MKNKFKIGDEVEIVNYGHHVHVVDGSDDMGRVIDFAPDLIGQKAVVKEVSLTQGFYEYVLDGLHKVAWYNEDQLKKVNNVGA